MGFNVLVRSGHKTDESLTKADAVIDSMRELPGLFLERAEKPSSDGQLPDLFAETRTEM